MSHHDYPHHPGALPGCPACDAFTDALDRLDAILYATADRVAQARHDVDIHEDTRSAARLARDLADAVAEVEAARALPFPGEE